MWKSPCQGKYQKCKLAERTVGMQTSRHSLPEAKDNWPKTIGTKKGRKEGSEGRKQGSQARGKIKAKQNMETLRQTKESNG